MWQLEEPDHYRLGHSLEEELMACLLGGYGIPAEVGIAAYHRLRSQQRWHPELMMDENRVEALLSEPLDIDGRSVRYRFARQKARYLSQALKGLADIDLDLGDRELRDALCSLKGVGPKTASWIVRNWRGSDDVAILDVHLMRAGRELGLFRPEQCVVRHYREIENAFVDFAKDIGAKASVLDSVIWMAFRSANRTNRSRNTLKRPANNRQGELELVPS